MRYRKIEHAILKLIVNDTDPPGRGFTLSGLRNLVAQDVPDASGSELVDAIKRLSHRGVEVLEPRKWNPDTRAFEAYKGADDERFFWTGDFRLRKTPHTQPYFEELEREVGPEPERRKIGF
jgi:hypothetical protein